MFSLEKDILESKRKKEKEIVALMISIYCKKNHHVTELCHSCKQLMDYSFLKIDNCPFTEDKSFCSNCAIHCYDQHMREKIRAVMKFSGPKMIFYHPIMAINHMIQSLK